MNSEGRWGLIDPSGVCAQTQLERLEISTSNLECRNGFKSFCCLVPEYLIATWKEVKYGLKKDATEFIVCTRHCNCVYCRRLNFEKQNKSNYSLRDSENKLVVPFPGTIAT